jgi:SWI/SNF-related matrix-associated actin-dependent regulator 1 of chromatin subfamily A
MFPLLKFLDPINFNNKSDFAKRFCDGGIDENGRWDASGASNLDELNAFLRSVLMVRRMKSQVLKQLPPKIRQVIYLDADERTKEILKFQDNIIGNIPYTKCKDSNEFVLDEEAFTRTIRSLPVGTMQNLMALRKEAALAKMPQAIEHYKERLEGFSKILIFAHHTEVIRALQKAFEGISVMIDGSVAVDKRQEIVREFNTNPDLKIFIGQEQAAGVGLNLTSAQLVSFMEECLRPGDTSQCEDRAHRIGQQGSVLVEHLILKDSMDAAIAKMVIEKQMNIEKAINKKESQIA